MPGDYTFNSGSRILEPLADKLGMRSDQVNFILCQCISIPVAFLYARRFPASPSNRTLRLAIPAILGISIIFFCFGSAIKHVVADVLVSYLILLYAPREHVHKLTFAFAMAYLCFIHFYRVLFVTTYIIDLTGPMMIVTQKLTSLAFSLHDGRVKKEEELTELQKSSRLKEVPQFLEYLSYTFQFQSILCGPFFLFSDYIAFIDTPVEAYLNGNNNDSKGKPVVIDPTRAVMSKLYISVICGCFAAFITPMIPPEALLIEPLLSSDFFTRFSFCFMSMLAARMQYYYAWTMAEAVSNASGFGFNGIRENGETRWDKHCNVRIWEYELALSMREALQHWNCTTVLWLRMVGYERVSTKHKTIVTFFLSAVWHGFYPGYYLTFVGGSLFTVCGRIIRRKIRPHFVDNHQRLYDFITGLGTKMALCYATFPFVMLHGFWTSLQIYQSFYFFMHIGGLAVVVLVPRLVPTKSTTVNAKKD